MPNNIHPMHSQLLPRAGMRAVSHMVNTGAATDPLDCNEIYTGIIRKALASANSGNAFAPFHPRVLQALATVYSKGPRFWYSVTKRFKEANGLIPLHHLDLAMTCLVATTAGNQYGANHSMKIGAALTAARAGDAGAPFAYPVLLSLIALEARDDCCSYNVHRAFRRANKEISQEALDEALKNVLFSELFYSEGPKSALKQLLNCQWDRPTDDSGELLVYWHPLSHLAC